jgi:biopolymer transport protein ExbB
MAVAGLLFWQFCFFFDGLIQGEFGMDAQFGLAHVWAQGDWVTRTVALILLGMSLASWLVILIKALDLRTYRLQAQGSEAFWRATNVEDGLRQLGSEAHNPFRHLAETGRDAARHLQPLTGAANANFNGTANAVSNAGINAVINAPHASDSATPHAAPLPIVQPLRDQLDVSDWVTRELRNSIDETTARLQGGMAVLASVGSTAPFVGLFGTVWGIYHALLGIGAAGQATIDKVAGPIGEALIMTALGLAVAIPAVLGYNALVRGNKGVLHKLNRFAHDLHALFVTGARVNRLGS